MQVSMLKGAKKWYDKNVRLVATVFFVVIVILLAFDSVLQIPSSVYFGAIAFLILLILDHVASAEKQGQEWISKLFTDDMKALEDISMFIKSRSVKNVDAIEYSGITITNMIRDLMKTDCKIRLLLYDPRSTDDPIQRARIKDSYFMKRNEFENAGKASNLQIGFYETPASLRGRNFDNRYVSAGWLVFFKSVNPKRTKMQVRGHDKPIVNTYASTKEGSIMLDFFNEQFDKLWKTRIDPKQIEEWWVTN